jgi:DNA recombination protein RmuC
LYKKFCLFAKNFSQIGQGIRQLAGTYERAEKQLASGRGNIVAQLEGWKKKGLTPTTDIPESLRALHEETDDDELPAPTAAAEIADDEENKAAEGEE